LNEKGNHFYQRGGGGIIMNWQTIKKLSMQHLGKKYFSSSKNLLKTATEPILSYEAVDIFIVTRKLAAGLA